MPLHKPPHTENLDVDIPDENYITSFCNQNGGAAGNYDGLFECKKRVDELCKNSNNIKSHEHEKIGKDQRTMSLEELVEHYHRLEQGGESKRLAWYRDKTRRKKKKRNKKKKTAKAKEAVSLD